MLVDRNPGVQADIDLARNIEAEAEARSRCRHGWSARMRCSIDELGTEDEFKDTYNEWMKKILATQAMRHTPKEGGDYGDGTHQQTLDSQEGSSSRALSVL